jgi:hypothetical protein
LVVVGVDVPVDILGVGVEVIGFLVRVGVGVLVPTFVEVDVFVGVKVPSEVAVDVIVQVGSCTVNVNVGIGVNVALG